MKVMTLEEEKRGLKIMHFALSMGALLIMMILHFFIKKIDLGTTSNDLSMIEMGALVLAAFNLLFANYLFKSRTANLATEQFTAETAHQYRGAYIAKWALIEAALLINIQLYMFIGDNAILAIVAILLLLLLYLSKPKFD